MTTQVFDNNELCSNKSKSEKKAANANQETAIFKTKLERRRRIEDLNEERRMREELTGF